VACFGFTYPAVTLPSQVQWQCMAQYISVAARVLLLQEPRFYTFQLYAAHKNVNILRIAGTKTASPSAVAHLMRHCLTFISDTLSPPKSMILNVQYSRLDRVITTRISYILTVTNQIQQSILRQKLLIRWALMLMSSATHYYTVEDTSDKSVSWC